MTAGEAALQLREDGVVLLRDVFSASLLERFRRAALRCFAAVEAGAELPERYKFNRFSNSMLVAALADSCLAGPDASEEELTAPLANPELATLIAEVLDGEWVCRLEHSWVRKKLAPGNLPDGRNVAQGWHQDGALGVRFPQEPGVQPSMTELVTCWCPLNACGADAPGLELVRGPQPGLLHFTELADGDLRRRFAAERFWAPEMGPGDALIFQNSVLHRTYLQPHMQKDRISVEYRIFPA